MCMTTDHDMQHDFLQKHKGVISVWKVYVVDKQGDMKVLPPYMSHGGNIKQGEIVSDRNHKHFNAYQDRDYNVYGSEWDVEKGIHVYLTQEHAQVGLTRMKAALDTWSERQMVIFKCTAKMKDYVAAGIDDFKSMSRRPNPSQAVFMKTYISKENWKKSLRGDFS